MSLHLNIQGWGTQTHCVCLPVSEADTFLAVFYENNEI